MRRRAISEMKIADTGWQDETDGELDHWWLGKLANAPLHVGTSTFCTKMPVPALHVNGEIILHPLLEPTAAS